ncbi:MAG TPA: 2-C-methyl-D-erythritol 2,4-cyclodiphosphate synthase [Pirellulaceae bacterium]|nr:2-C-methyl-D-erythritol 2,4-cyclodiphosphate synthase [Pirellulaceae bacterium]
MGYDRHRLGPAEGPSPTGAEGLSSTESERPLLLGGVEIPFDQVLIGHSDADVLLHAVTDAVLGAAGLGDIGELFPNDDARNFRRDSSEMLSLAWQSVRSGGWNLVNLDIVLLAQSPKISPYKEAIRRRIAEILGVEHEQINLKGKTGEEVGTVGRGESIDVHCVALLERVTEDEA